MDVTRAWLEFIYKNRKLPVMYDFIRLFVFSLHLCYRVRPFDANPPNAILNQPRFDVSILHFNKIHIFTVLSQIDYIAKLEILTIMLELSINLPIGKANRIRKSMKE